MTNSRRLSLIYTSPGLPFLFLSYFMSHLPEEAVLVRRSALRCFFIETGLLDWNLNIPRKITCFGYFRGCSPYMVGPAWFWSVFSYCCVIFTHRIQLETEKGSDPMSPKTTNYTQVDSKLLQPKTSIFPRKYAFFNLLMISTATTHEMLSLLEKCTFS